MLSVLTAPVTAPYFLYCGLCQTSRIVEVLPQSPSTVGEISTVLFQKKKKNQSNMYILGEGGGRLKNWDKEGEVGTVKKSFKRSIDF